ncbi:HNH endonuclease signature motif containing protein [Williamsia maris]|uniref:DUF222 domain-containing protein n=1 Tax=Williamsia maris TaxID=72806 RepID=A0ABT1H9A9_9NOCA|nr:HNH endonuclease signature motif containing protein [Williamsia maris]MCP2174848.1 protein of unknown function (DUF222) [Williamsia maris]
MFAGVDVSMVDDQLASSHAADTVALLRQTRRAENRCAAAKVFTARRLFDLRRTEIAQQRHRAVFGHMGDKGATIEVATTLKVSTGVAWTWIELAAQLDDLPDLRDTFYRGDIDLARVRTIADAAAHLDEMVRKIMESAALEMADQAMSTREMRDRLDTLLIEIDPDQAAAERTDFERNQKVSIRPDRHGHSTLDACIPADLGAELEAAITGLIAGICDADPRTIGQRRVAAVRAITRHQTALDCQCGSDDCLSATTKPGEPGTDIAPEHPHVMVHVDAATLAGMTGAMVPYIEGQGPIDPDYARLLATDATWQGLFDDATTKPSTTDASATGFRHGKRRTAGVMRGGPPDAALRYTPSQSLRDWIIWADQTCRFPGCDHPAPTCDIDHTIPFDHTNPSAGGWTVRINLAALCRLHHHAKTVGLWQATMHPDRTITWTNPQTGEQIVSYPRH